jgi:hypothetical protein
MFDMSPSVRKGRVSCASWRSSTRRFPSLSLGQSSTTKKLGPARSVGSSRDGVAPHRSKGFATSHRTVTTAHGIVWGCGLRIAIPFLFSNTKTQKESCS